MLQDSYNPFWCFRDMIFSKPHRVVRMTKERGIRHLLKLHCSKRFEADHVESLTIDDTEALRDVTKSNSNYLFL